MAERATLARPYAEAAFVLAREEKALASWSDALAALAVIASHEAVRTIVSDPRTQSSEKVALLCDLVAQKVSVPTSFANFVRLLVENNRLPVAQAIADLFEERRRALEGRLRAEVVSAFPLDEAQRQKVAADLQEYFGKPVDVEVRVDPALIGGVKIVVGDDVIDASVAGKLARMAAALNV
ncbi:MAG: F0F1 ATP synthase subunit delta [Hydrogenophilus sp.]|nr:F0F1 ATP synthase subunit delta [Hydrogenophilus sp.]